MRQRHTTKRVPSRAPARRRLELEALEHRLAPATFTVTHLDDAGAGSLRQAVLDANALPGADTIRFAKSAQGTITLSSGEIAISDAVMIQGLGAARLAVSGNGSSRVFHVLEGTGEVAIEKLSIMNGQAEVGGGVFNEAGGDLTLRQVVVSGNQTEGTWPPDGLGGGIYTLGALTVVNSTFTHNRAQFGGAIATDLDSSSVTLTNCTFTENEAQASGAIDVYYSSFLTVSNCTFTRNRATGLVDGGDDAVGTTGAAGAISALAAQVNFDHCDFLENEAITPDGYDIAWAYAGAVSVVSDGTSSASLSVTHCQFSGNVARSGGGVASFAHSGAMDISNFGFGEEPLHATISHCQFLGNQAVGGDEASTWGGGLTVWSGTIVDVTHTQFIGNVARGGNSDSFFGGGAQGGGIANQGADLRLSHCQIIGNQALAGDSGDGWDGGIAQGGGLFNNGTTTMSHVVIAGNVALGGAGGAGGQGGQGLGGGVFLQSFGSTQVAIDHSLIAGNLAQGGAGGVGGNGGAGLGGGLFAEPNTTLTLSHSVVTQNGAVGGQGGAGGSGGAGIGGGLYLTSGATAKRDEWTSISENHASTSDEDVFGTLELF